MALAAPFPAPRVALRQSVRLTRRGRVLLVLLSTAFLLLAVLLSGRITADAGAAVGDLGRATGVVVVQPGENLWQIARAIAPGVDPRETVSLIRSLNGLGERTVIAGQSIIVPA